MYDILTLDWEKCYGSPIPGTMIPFPEKKKHDYVPLEAVMQKQAGFIKPSTKIEKKKEKQVKEKEEETVTRLRQSARTKEKRAILKNSSGIKMVMVGRLENLVRYAVKSKGLQDVIVSLLTEVPKSICTGSRNAMLLFKEVLELASLALDPGVSSLALDGIDTSLYVGRRSTRRKTAQSPLELLRGDLQSFFKDLENSNLNLNFFRLLLTIGIRRNSDKLSLLLQTCTASLQRKGIQFEDANYIIGTADIIRQEALVLSAHCMEILENLEFLQTEKKEEYEELISESGVFVNDSNILDTVKFVVLNMKFSSPWKMVPSFSYTPAGIYITELSLLSLVLTQAKRTSSEDLEYLSTISNALGDTIKALLCNFEGKKLSKIRKRIAKNHMKFYGGFQLCDGCLYVAFTRPESSEQNLRPYEFSKLVDQKPNRVGGSWDEYSTIQEKSDYSKLMTINSLGIKPSVIGADPGDRYAIGYTAIRSNNQIAYCNVKKRSYYGPTSDHYVSYLAKEKRDDVQNAESVSPMQRTTLESAAMSEFYSSPDVLSKRKNMKVLQRKWLQQQFSVFMSAVGANVHTKFYEWVEHKKAFLFVFGTSGGNFKGRGQASIDGTVQDFFIKSVS